MYVLQTASQHTADRQFPIRYKAKDQCVKKPLPPSTLFARRNSEKKGEVALDSMLVLINIHVKVSTQKEITTQSD